MHRSSDCLFYLVGYTKDGFLTESITRYRGLVCRQWKRKGTQIITIRKFRREGR